MTHIQEMSQPDVPELFAGLDGRQSREEYNFEHFRTQHFLADVAGTLEKRGIRPGDVAPDFELSRVGGGDLRLSALRGRPTLLHMGSPT